jgi:hypothetical protein
VEALEVLVIGTDPPCPRCDLLLVRAEEVARALSRPIRVRHVPFFSKEATIVGQKAGRRLGTPGHVAEAAGITVDSARRDELIAERRKVAGEVRRPADLWTPALDALLDECRAAADSVGFLVTPILVVDGEVKHHGNVPSADQIGEWLIAVGGIAAR